MGSMKSSLLLLCALLVCLSVSRSKGTLPGRYNHVLVKTIFSTSLFHLFIATEFAANILLV